MSFVTIKRVVRAGFLSFWRNAFVSFSSILIMVETLFILGLVIFSGIVLNLTLQQLENQADINVYFATDAPTEKIAELQASVETLPQVLSVEYVTAEEALAAFRDRHQNDQLTLQALSELGQNPLGAVLNIRAKDIAQYDAIANFLKQQQEIVGSPTIIDKVNYFDERHRSALTNLQTIIQSGGRIGLVVIILFAVTTVTTLFNMIRLTIFSSRDEIHVMRLVGAGQFYIRAPFMVEGMLQGLIAGIVTLTLFYPLAWWLGGATVNFFGGINIFNFYLENFPLFFLIIVGTGVFFGGLANFLAVRRYVKV